MGFGISEDLSIVFLEVAQAIVPVDWHGEGISHEKSQ
jgi:hypothetical protein